MLAGIIRRANFQRVNDLLASSFDHRAHIAEGESLQQVVISEHAFLYGVADGTAVHHGNIRIQNFPVSIRHKIAQVGFAVAHPALAGLGIIACQFYKSLAYRLVQNRLKAFVLFGHQFCDFLICFFQAFYQFGSDGSVFTDSHLSQALELGSGLGNKDLLACFVDDLMRRNVLFMRMAVNDGVYVVGVGRDSAAGPVGNGTVRSQMPYQEHILRPVPADIINSPLYGFIDFFSCLVFAKTVDKFPVFILEIFRSGGNQGFRGGNTNKSDLFPAQNNDLIGFQNRFPGLHINKIAGIIAAFLFWSQFQKTRHTVIKLMVAGNRKIIPDRIHNFHD